MEEQDFKMQKENSNNLSVSINDKKEKLPNNHITFAIISTILNLFTCNFIGLIFGILSIIFANQVNIIYNTGDYLGAILKSKNARILSIISLIIFFSGILIFIIYILFIIFFGNITYYQGWFKNTYKIVYNN
ncbi:Interferon-induced transmembrane protein [Apibacter mensalis]|uniref:Interferon-induced transmembrane protein n=1 Tax=Apibacter mensalis TaxID=1586267 RepID=A0A0X3ANF6_9FLAO|nr:CD225/dispanin family protein [Apibacter mensalis]CVK16679.1 Interferon-induced transmembrane protein [Apibacter mensalis]